MHWLPPKSHDSSPASLPLFLSPIFQGVCGQGSQPELGHFPGQPSGLERGFGSPRLPSSSSFSGPSSLFRCQLLPLHPVTEAARRVLPPYPCRWRERSWACFGHPCEYRRLNAMCVTVWEPGLTDGPRAPPGISRCFVTNSHLVLCPGLHSASGWGIGKRAAPVQRQDQKAMQVSRRFSFPDYRGVSAALSFTVDAPRPNCPAVSQTALRKLPVGWAKLRLLVLPVHSP